jgi:diguanylate cyclase (GGDEF)-like protein
VRLRTGRRILDLQAELVSARETLRYQATHDGLTGLLNRSAALDALRNELERVTRQGAPLCLMLADVDHFKEVNDTYGHMVGDAVLCEAARRMRSSVRPHDSVGRYGGEEFIFILPGCDGENARNLAQRLQACVTSPPVELPRLTISFTISIGVVVKYNAVVEDLDSLIQAADTALYEAKVKGRNRFVLSERTDAPLKSALPVTLQQPRA